MILGGTRFLIYCLSVGRAVLAITTGKKRYSRLSGGLCCCIVSVFGSGRKLAVFLLWREIFITTGKKRYSHLSGRCAINYDRKTKKIQSSVCWVRGSGDYDRKKKDAVVCLAGCAVVSVFGSGGKLAFFCSGGKL